MACCHEETCCAPSDSRGNRAVLWTVLGINAVMFAVELSGGLIGRSVALQADALDFLGDALLYGVTLAALGQSARTRAASGLVKGAAMGALGLWVLGMAGWQAWAGTVPHAPTMGGIGLAALLANALCLGLLLRFRTAESNLRGVWLCSRNDVLANLAVLAAGSGVWLSGTGWPDLAVALLIAGLNLHAAGSVLRQGLREWRAAPEALRPALADTQV